MDEFYVGQGSHPTQDWHDIEVQFAMATIPHFEVIVAQAGSLGLWVLGVIAREATNEGWSSPEMDALQSSRLRFGYPRIPVQEVKGAIRDVLKVEIDGVPILRRFGLQKHRFARRRTVFHVLPGLAGRPPVEWRHMLVKQVGLDDLDTPRRYLRPEDHPWIYEVLRHMGQ